MKHTIQAAAVVLLAASTAQAQQTAVQWRVEDGGNGHWYQLVVDPAGLTWPTARQRAQALGGDLAVCSRPGSTAFMQSILGNSMCGGSTGQAGPYVGGFQDLAASDYSEPAGGWRWVDGSPFPGSAVISLDDNLGHQDYLHFISLQPSCGGPFVLDDVGLVANSNRGFIIQWSADCNGDGIVDYGQILGGDLPDTNQNGVPDACEPSPQPLHAYDFESGVLDRVGNADGVLLNGAVIRSGALFTDGIDDYVDFSARLIPTAGPFTVALRFKTVYLPATWMELISQGCSGCGAFYLGRAINGQWRYWLDNGDVNTGVTYPVDGSWHHVAATYQPNGLTKLYVDRILVAQFPSTPLSATGADTRLACQFDLQEQHPGYIDDLRIYDVALTAMEISRISGMCTGDVLVDGIVNGADLGGLLSYWGPTTSSPVSQACDLNGDGRIDGSDLGMLLWQWGPCS